MNFLQQAEKSFSPGKTMPVECQEIDFFSHAPFLCFEQSTGIIVKNVIAVHGILIAIGEGDGVADRRAR